MLSSVKLIITEQAYYGTKFVNENDSCSLHAVRQSYMYQKQTGESFFPEKVYKNPNTSKCLAIILLNNSNGWSIYHILKLN